MKEEKRGLLSGVIYPITNFKSLDKNKKLIVINAILVVVILIAGGGFFAVSAINKGSDDDVKNIPGESTTEDNIQASTSDGTEEEEVYRNPLNGLELEKEVYEKMDHRPLAVMLDNAPEARTVAENLNKTDLVYEALTEGGYTRFLGIYYSQREDIKIMPVRSIRNVFLDFVHEYNDILLYHVGGAHTPNNPKTNAVQRIFDENVKSLYYQDENFNLWNLYNENYDQKCLGTDIPGYSCKFHMMYDLRKKAEELGYEDEPWYPEKEYDFMWRFEEKTDTSKAKSKANTINYTFTPHPRFGVEWKYDEKEDKYLRWNAGEPSIDHSDESQVWTETIVVLKKKHVLDVDDKLRSEVYSTGEGEGYVFMDGDAYEVRWEKECDNCRTRLYYKGTQEEFIFTPGRMWVSITTLNDEVGVGA